MTADDDDANYPVCSVPLCYNGGESMERDISAGLSHEPHSDGAPCLATGDLQAPAAHAGGLQVGCIGMHVDPGWKARARHSVSSIVEGPGDI